MGNSHILSIILQVVDRATPQLRATQNQIDRMSRTISDFGKTSRVMDFTKRLNTVGLTMNSIGRIIDINTKQFISMGSAVERVGKLGSESFGGMNKLLLGIGLGMTFFMWGIQMQLQRMLRSMFNVFKLAEGETGALNQQFNIVRANLAAISIAFFDAFASSGLFEKIVEIVISLADWFLNLSDRARSWTVGLVIGLTAAIALISIGGQFVLAIGTFVQLWQTIFGTGGKLATTTAQGMGKEGVEGTTVGNFAKGFSLMKTLIGAGLVIKTTMDMYKSISDDKPTPFMTILKEAIMGGAGAGLLVWGAGAGLATGGLVALATAAIIITVLLSTNAMKQRLGELNAALKKNIFTPELITADDMSFGISPRTGTTLPQSAKDEQARLAQVGGVGGFQIDWGAMTKAVREGTLGALQDGKIGVVPITNSTSN